MKSILAAVLVAAGLVALATMFSLMGRSKRQAKPESLRAVHRAAGYVFAALVVVLAVLGTRYLAAAGESLSLRAVLHWILALFLIVVLALKIGIVRFYRELTKFAPALGMIVFVLTLVLAGSSAGFFVITGARQKPFAGAPAGTASVDAVAGVDQQAIERGAALFARHCASCHAADSEEWKIGPGLRGVLVREALVSTGMPAIRANVRNQIVAPAGSMPAFGPILSERELVDLLAYLDSI